MNKKDLTERDICTKFITPNIEKAGWDVQSQIREEVYFTKGRIIVRGKLVTRGKAKRADYILYYKPNIPIALIEAKDNNQEIWYYEHRVPEGQKAYSMTRPIRFEHMKPCIDWWDTREENEVAWKVTIDEIKARNYNLDFKNPHVVDEDHGDPAELLAKLEQSEAETAKLRDKLKAILKEALLR